MDMDNENSATGYPGRAFRIRLIIPRSYKYIWCFNPYCSGITAVGHLQALETKENKGFQSLLFWNYRCGRSLSRRSSSIRWLFQSLLFWNYRCGAMQLNQMLITIEVSILIVLELPLWGVKLLFNISAILSFNPYCSGITAVGSASGAEPTYSSKFQSLLFWNYRCGLGFCRNSTPIQKFQSLLFWNYRCGPHFFMILVNPIHCFNPYCSGITAVGIKSLVYNP